MKEWKVILATLVIFCTGVVTGGLLVHLTAPQKQSRTNKAPGTPPIAPKDLRGNVHDQRLEYIRRLKQMLALEGDQPEKIEKLVRESQLRAKSIWDSVAPKLNEEHAKVRIQIRDVLTEEQRRKFDEMNLPLPALSKSKDNRPTKKPTTRAPGAGTNFAPGAPTNSEPR